MMEEVTNSSFEANVEIKNKLGMHTRAATLFVQLASSFPCEVYLSKDGQEVNGKSIMGILMLVAGIGTQLKLRCEGESASKAIKALSELIDSKFGEPE